MKLNKLNVYVVDQKKKQARADLETVSQAFNALSKQTAPASKPKNDAAEAPAQEAQGAVAPAGLAAQREQATKAFARLRALVPKM